MHWGKARLQDNADGYPRHGSNLIQDAGVIDMKTWRYLDMRLAPADPVLLLRPRAIPALTKMMTWKAGELES